MRVISLIFEEIIRQSLRVFCNFQKARRIYITLIPLAQRPPVELPSKVPSVPPQSRDGHATIKVLSFASTVRTPLEYIA